MKNPQKLVRILALILGDVVILCLGQFLALFVRFEFDLEALRQSGFLENVLWFLPLYLVMSVAIFACFRLYNSLWAYAGVDELLHIAAAAVLTAVAQFWLIHMAAGAAARFSIPAPASIGATVPRSFPVLNALFLCALLLAERFSYRFLRQQRRHLQQKAGRRTMLIGAGQGATMVLREFLSSEQSQNKVVCIIDDDRAKQGSYLFGVPVVGGRDKILSAAQKYRVEEIVFAIPSASRTQKRELLSLCQKTGCTLKTLPAIYQLANGEVSVRSLRTVNIEDLLGRDAVKVDLDTIAGYVQGKTVLVTGGGGSIGSELCRQIAAHKPAELIIFDIYENNAYEIQQELLRKHRDLKLTVRIGSVRDRNRVDWLFETFRPQIVFHAAAHKHVPLMEDSPAEAVKNNIFGTRNVAEAADRFGAETFVLISTDKAVNPTSVMGATKRVCEMLVQSMSTRSATRFVAVRFGNVLGSNGSVIPLFKRQIQEGGPVTVTHRDMVRYFMTIPEAVSLILQAGAFAKGGEIFILDMGEPVRIDDLARNMIRLSGLEPETDIPIVYTGLRPGEKLFEEILMEEEGMRKTDNALIYIGRPLEFDQDVLDAQLDCLARADASEVRDQLRQIVREYHPMILKNV